MSPAKGMDLQVICRVVKTVTSCSSIAAYAAKTAKMNCGRRAATDGEATVSSDQPVEARCRFCAFVCKWWGHVLDFALVCWIVRVPLVAVIIGFLLFDRAPQAQDLLVEFAGDYARVVAFLCLLFVLWAAVTHYAARLLLNTD